MTFEEFLQSPYLDVIGKKMLEENKSKLERKYAELNKYAAVGGAVILGDSLVEYFPVQELFEQKIYNRGIGGDTSEETLKRLDKTVLPLKPEKAILWVGTNDIQAGLSLAQTLENVTNICQRLEKECGTKIYILSVAPVNTISEDTHIRMAVGVRDNQKISEINAGYKNLCEKNNWTYIDVYDRLVCDGTLPESLSEDGLHVNIAGYMPVVNAVKTAVFKEN